MGKPDIFSHLSKELENIINTKKVSYEQLLAIIPESHVPQMLKPIFDNFTFNSTNYLVVINQITIDALVQIAIENKTYELKQINKNEFIREFIKIVKKLPYKIEISIGFTNDSKYSLPKPQYKVEESPQLYLTSINQDFTGLNDFPLLIQYGLSKPISFRNSGNLLGITGEFYGYDDDIELDLISERIERTITLLFILGFFELKKEKANDLTSSLVYVSSKGTLKQRYMNYEISRLKSLFKLSELQEKDVDVNLMIINKFYTLKKKSGKEYLAFDNNLRLYSLILGTKHTDIKISLMITLLENLSRVDLSKEERINHSSLSYIIANEIGQSYKSRVKIKTTIEALVEARNKIVHEGSKAKGLNENIAFGIEHTQYLMFKRLVQLIQ